MKIPVKTAVSGVLCFLIMISHTLRAAASLVAGALSVCLALMAPANSYAAQHYVFEFDGQGDFAQLEHNDSIDLTEELTFAAWVYARGWSGRWHQFAGKGDDSWMLRRHFGGNDLHLALRGLDTDFLGYTAPKWEMPLHEWTHLAFTFSSEEGKARLYANGQAILEDNELAGTLNSNNSPFVAGAHKAGPGSARRFHDGHMSDVRLYNRALSSAEITHILERTRDVVDGLVVHWKLDEGSGRIATDSSGAGNHGEIIGGSWATVDEPFWGVRIPKLQGLYREEAESIIESAGFAVGEVAEVDAAGRVVRQYPEADRRAPQGAPVSFMLSDAVRIIFDTDMDTDCDDAGALAMLHALADKGEAEILATVVSTKYPWSVGATQAINAWYGRAHLPLGSPLLGEGADPRRGSRFARQLTEEFNPPMLYNTQALDAVEVYRRVLAGQPDNSVVIVTVGYATNLRHLLDSGADEHSPLSGVELVEQKVREWVCMGSRYPADLDPGVWGNFKPDPKATVEAVYRWPTQITFTGGGGFAQSLATGECLSATPEDNPVRRAYELYFGREPRNRHSADQIAVLVAVRGAEHHYWELVTEGHNHIFPNGTHEWREQPDNPKHRYISALAVGVTTDEVTHTIEELMVQPPSLNSVMIAANHGDSAQ